MSENRPKIGVGVIVRKGDKVLLGKRKNAHGDGEWSFPGGHLEFGETVAECALREVAEETGLGITSITKGPYTEDVFEKEGKHYVTLFMLCDHVSGEVKLMEPHKCEKWEWFTWNNLPSPLFLPIKHLIEQGFNPFN
jgi:8-oxo-dGTP diphosphatase